MSQKLSEIEKTSKFTWGKPIELHKIGPYTLLEYYPWRTSGPSVARVIDYSSTAFHGWFDDEDTNQSWPSLEAGIAGLIGEKWGGRNNGGVGYYFCKMIDAPPYDKVEVAK